MKKLHLIISLIITSSCSPVIYSTLSPNTPLPGKKGDFQIGSGNTIYSSAHGGSFGFTLQGSYAFTNDFFVSSNYLGWFGSIEPDTLNNGSGFSLFDSNSWDSDGNIIELGLGKYWCHKDDNRWRGTVNAGIGFGMINNLKNDFDFIDIRYHNYFLQPAGGFKSDVFSFIFSLKINHLNMRSLNWRLSDNFNNQRLLDFYQQNNNKIHLEPGISLGIQLNAIIFSVKYAWTGFSADDLGENGLSVIMNRNFTVSVTGALNLKKKK